MSDLRPPDRAVIAIVKGGLGNQMFIYAAARALALRTGRSLWLDSRRGFASDRYGRDFRLDRFDHAAREIPEAWRVAPTLRHPRHKWIRAWSKLLPRDVRAYIAERRGRGADQLTDLRPWRRRVTLLGYWQDEAYFADEAAAIGRELSPPAPIDARNLALGEEIGDESAVFLHVRRRNYPELLPADYYQRAIDFHHARTPRPRFYLFGDDPGWPAECLDFHGSPVTAVDWNERDEIADLWLMSRCRHAITANSSFSWWGAWLGPRETVVANREAAYSPRIPDSWLTI